MTLNPSDALIPQQISHRLNIPRLGIPRVLVYEVSTLTELVSVQPDTEVYVLDRGIPSLVKPS